MSTDVLQQIDQDISDNQKIVQVGEALERLKANKDFQSIITSGYLEKEAIRLVHLKADISFQSDAMQRSILTQIDAIGALDQYFDTIRQKTHMSRKAIEACEGEREEVLSETEGADHG